MRIAVILTVFNRKEQTLLCLTSLSKQKNMPNYDVYMCDDGSTDGTADAVLKQFRNVNVIQGTGGLFWSRGMARAMSAAVEKGYDLYLMINDDVCFYYTMWETMMAARSKEILVGVTGCTQSRINGNLTYSGAKFYHDNGKRYVGNKISPIIDKKQECDVANWNCFLIDKEVVRVVGLIDATYEHSFGDFDYSLRMRKAGIPIYLTDRYIGNCESNTQKNTYLDRELSRKIRVKKLLSPNGLPVKSWLTFTFRYYGVSALQNFFAPYIKFMIELIK